MKKVLITILLSGLLITLSNAQNIAITDDNAYTANPSAMLDVKSLTKGLLVPRMTTIQRNAITSPATGLLVFDTNTNEFFYYTGTAWTNLSYGQLWSRNGSYVYLTNTDENVGIGVTAPDNKLLVKADATTGIDESIFAVLNSNGDTVFAVYQEGVRIWVNDAGGTKANGSRGGFAVGGFSPTKLGVTNEYLRVTPDSVRIYIDDSYIPAKANGSRGGFAVGGFSPAKGTPTRNYLFVQDDSTRVYVADSTEGFGVENIQSANNQRIMNLTTENYFIGHESGISSTTAKYNNFLGYKAGTNITSGSNNIFIGYESGFNSDVQNNNVFIGYKSGYNTTFTIGADYNVFIGSESGYNNTSGANNTFLGFNAGFSNTTSSAGVYIGKDAGYSNATGNANTYVGYQSGYNSTEYGNTFVGYLAGWQLVTGINNCMIGAMSGAQQTSGDYNTYLGKESAYNNATGLNNVVLGYQAGRGVYGNSYSQNVFVGTQAGFSITTGTNNVAIGYSSLYSNTTGFRNYAGGVNALNLNTTGFRNTAVGNRAMANNTTGYYNTAMGDRSLLNLSSGDYNTAIGIITLDNVTTGNYNTALGSYAASDIGATTTSCTYIGYNADNSTASSYSNSTCLGYNARITASNQVRIGNTLVTSIGGYAAWSNLSDERFKMNVKENVPGLEFVTKLRPVTYNVNVGKLDEFLNIADSIRNDKNYMENAKLRMQEVQTGFIAQEVERVAEECGFDFNGIDKPENDNEHYSLRYSEFVVPLVKAVQEQQEIIEKLEDRIKEMQKEINSLQKEI